MKKFLEAMENSSAKKKIGQRRSWHSKPQNLLTIADTYSISSIAVIFDMNS